eukprot:gnl/MRDRNA2_/MRDRNA2_30181_c0_seq1.p1 gnl/MRDRNA2_/MRDRNA2_30181_c0~~gnl/MRDRNA2_/MRDRNA2_30181_c0_seq1.p1  ORF type:complete len:438 (-),score=104.38 gnl/MRDRNA2_/MRDRNA2_30181_c0_seq1:113-1426(-)
MVSMGSTRKVDEWHASSNFNMTGAMNAQSDASKQCDTSLRTHKQCLDENLTQYHTLHASLQSKVNVSRQLGDVLQKRIRSVTTSIMSTKQTLAALEEAHNAKNAPLQLCSWRMDQRAKRPHRELIRDPFEVALEDEKDTLTKCQMMLKNGMMKTENCIASLEDSLKDLQHDFQLKSEALQIDEQCLRTTHKTWHRQVETKGPPLGKLPQVTSRAFSTTNNANEDQRQSDTMKRHTIATDKESAAQQLRDEMARLINQCQRNADKAKSTTESAMQARIQENQTMRKRLENEIRETNDKIQRTKATTGETSAHIESLIEPTKLCDTRDHWRKNRPYREQILDPVSTSLVEHRMHLTNTSNQLEQRRREEHQTLNNLMKHKEQLKEDLKDKTQALHIDLDCLSHANVYGKGSKAMTPRPGRVLKMDASFVPSGGFASGRP